VLAILAPRLQREIGWSELDYGRIVIAFQAAYAGMMAVAGALLDRMGVKLGYALAIVVWSLAAMGHALARSAAGFGVARFALGLGEAANFPAAVKAIGEWFPARERALAVGIFNGGTNVGAIAAPILVPLLAARFGWQGAFLATGALGFLWLAAWWWLYHRPEEHPRLRPEEREWIRSGTAPAREEPVSWRALLGKRQLGALAAAKLLTDPVWWFYLFWLPKFLDREHGLRDTAIIPYLTTVYVISDVGSIFGGYLSSALLARGWSVNAARKTALGLFAAIMPVVILAARARDPWTAVLLIGLAAGCHQAWSANVYALATDLFPRRAVGSAMGLAGAAGGFGGIAIAEFAGRILQRDPGWYLPMFVVAGGAYLVALAVVQICSPRLEPLPETAAATP
jgi:ACS family hexuronate transporter-like MFS transporter